MPVVEDVHYALDAISAPAFELAIEGIGLFGDATGPAPSMRSSALRRRSAICARGCSTRRAEPAWRCRASAFHPHVTLARIAAGSTGEDILRLEAFAASRAGFFLGPVPVDAFVLYRSRLGRGGAAYEAMATYPLAPP
jgi:RNA 2',3'-cyclic 3'-phosphodiesterase